MPVFTLPKSAHPDFALPNVKPKGPVEIDWNESLTKGLVAGTMADPGRNVVDKSSIVHSNTEILPNGNIRFTANDYLEFTPDLTGASGLTVYGRFKIGAGHTNYGAFFAVDGAHSSGFYLGTNEYTSNWQLQGFISSDGFNVSTTGVETGEWVNIGMTFTASGDKIIYVNGLAIGSEATAQTSLASHTKLRIGATTDPLSFAGDCEYGLFWDRALSPAEVADLDDHPYQILKPAIPLTYFMPAEEAAQYFTFELPKSHHPDFALPNVKPKGPVEIDWDNPLSKGLACYGLFGRQGRNSLEVIYDRFGIGPDTSNAVSTIGSEEGLLAVNPDTTADLCVAYSGFNNGIFSDHEATYIARFRRNSGDNNNLASIGGSLLSHYPFSGFVYMSIFRNTRLGPLSIYDAGLDDTVHNIAVTASDVANEHKIYTGGVVQNETTASWGMSSNGADQTLLDGSEKDAALIALWTRALSAEEIASLERAPYQILKPAIPLTYFVPGAAAGGGFQAAWARNANTIIQQVTR